MKTKKRKNNSYKFEVVEALKMGLFDKLKKKEKSSNDVKRTKEGFIKIECEHLISWNEPNGEGCIVSDKITKEGFNIGYMVREEPMEGNPDSGWQFMAGNEDDEYMDNPDNHHIFALNTVCNYDKAVIPFLKSPVGSAYIRISDCTFEIDDGSKFAFLSKQTR